MKKLMLSTALVGALSLPAMVVPAIAQDAFLTTAGEGDVRASEFIGKRLYASEVPAELDEYQGAQPDWQDIGEVNDVLLARDGTVDAVLVDIGGFLGMGEHQVAVDMGQIKFVSDSATADDPSDYFLVMTATKDVLQAAPAFEDAAMAPAPDAAATDAETAPADDTAAAPAETEAAPVDDTAAAPAETETAPADSAEAPAATETPDATAPADTAAAPAAPVSARDGFVAATAEAITSETLTGAPVYDPTDARVGEVSELVLDADGQVTQTVVDVGGFLGIGEKPVALPLDQIEIMQRTDTSELRVFVSQTKEQLEAMPAYEG